MVGSYDLNGARICSKYANTIANVGVDLDRLREWRVYILIVKEERTLILPEILAAALNDAFCSVIILIDSFKIELNLPLLAVKGDILKQ